MYLINAVILNKTGGLLLTVSLDMNTFFEWLFVLKSESNGGLKCNNQNRENIPYLHKKNAKIVTNRLLVLVMNVLS